jgi:hypothetical protein
MGKHVGSSAGVLALLAFLIHTLVPPSSEQGNNGVGTKAPGGIHSASKGAATGKPVGSEDAPAGKPVPAEGPWLASRQYFHQEPPADFKSTCLDYLLPTSVQKAPCDTAAMGQLFGLSATFDPKQLETLIATIPDPLHTRMSLMTDRSLDAIQGGAFEAGWEMATQWLPWTAKAGQIPEVPSGETAAPQIDLEQMPGLIVFRRQFVHPYEVNRLLFIFVVGETPTAGINGFQFTAAKHYIDGLSGASQISILGPTFSGSFMSLTKLIEDDGGNQDYDIRSGTVTNSVYAASMLDRLECPRKVTFHGSTLPSVSFDEQFETLADQQGFHDLQIANLVEDGSGFSVGVTSPNKITTYRYPRDIVQLRDAYSDVAFSSQPKAGGMAPQAVQFSLKDTQSGESDFPIFSTSHTPVSQNAILEQIVDDL